MRLRHRSPEAVEKKAGFRPPARQAREDIPTVRRPSIGWSVKRVLAKGLLAAGLLSMTLGAGLLPGLFKWAAVATGCQLLIAALVVFLVLLDSLQWLEIEPQGVRLRYLRREVRLDWDEISEVTDELIRTTGGAYELPGDLRDRNALVRMMRGIVRGVPLLPPAAIPQPSQEMLEKWFGPAKAGRPLRLWLPQAVIAISFPLAYAIFALLLAVVQPPDEILIVRVMPLIAFVLLSLLGVISWALPHSILLSPEFLELRYLLRRRRLRWDEILAIERLPQTSGYRIDTVSGSIFLPAEADQMAKLADLLASLREGLVGIRGLPPDDSERSLTIVSPETTGPSGRELAETPEQAERMTGRELDESE